MTDPDRLVEIEARLSLISPFPWHCPAAAKDNGRAIVVSNAHLDGTADLLAVFVRAHDARLAASAPQDLRWLIDQLRAAQRATGHRR